MYNGHIKVCTTIWFCKINFYQKISIMLLGWYRPAFGKQWLTSDFSNLFFNWLFSFLWSACSARFFSRSSTRSNSAHKLQTDNIEILNVNSTGTLLTKVIYKVNTIGSSFWRLFAKLNNMYIKLLIHKRKNSEGQNYMLALPQYSYPSKQPFSELFRTRFWEQ